MTRPLRVLGYHVWTAKYGYAFRNKLHPTREAAEAALAKVIWHNRHNFAVRPVYADEDIPTPRSET